MDCEPMRTFYAVQRNLGDGEWATMKLFYTEDWAKRWVIRTNMTNDRYVRVVPVEREIND